MTFAQPTWFWALAVIPLLIAIFLRNERLRTRTLQQLVAARLLDRLAGTASPVKRTIRFVLLVLGFACIVVSLAQPRWGFTWQERKTRGRDVIIAIDTSRSMLANDLAPNRLTRAKLAAEDLIGQLRGDRVGLVAFAGSSFLQAPLTADHSAVLGALKEVDTEIIPQGGTNIAGAIRTAVEAFGKGEGENRALVILTDGEELDADGIKIAKEQREIMKIFTVGIGSEEGTVIALPGSGGTQYVTDEAGQIVKSKLDRERLEAIAEAGGGFYLRLQSGLQDMTQLVQDGLGAMSENEINADVTRQPIERYQWPLGAGLTLLMLSMLIGERRRGTVSRQGRSAAVAATCLAFLLPISGRAASPGVLYEEGKYSDAQRAYEELLKKNPTSDRLAFNHGAAAYKNRDYDAALESFGKALTTANPELRARAEYNLGNTLFQQALKGMKEPDIAGLESALTHYDQARQLEPKSEDAQHNYDVTRQLIEQLKQKQEEEQKKQDEQKKDDEKKDDQKQDQEKKDQNQDQKDQDKKDGQQDKQESKDQSGKVKDQQKQDGQSQDQKDQEGKDQKDGKGGENQKDEKKDGKAGQNEKDQQQMADKGKEQEQKQGEQPEPVEGEQKNERKPEGELKNNPAPGKEGESPEQQEAAEEALAAAEGRMTESQAKELLDSLKGEDVRVQLMNPGERRSRERPIRNW